MKRNQGFTLIELIIVIVILGILAVTAAPRFLNFSGDARASTLSGVRGALESAGSLVYGKAIIAGEQNEETATLDDPAIDIVYGYPAATEVAIRAAAELAEAEWEVEVAIADVFGAVAGTDIVIAPAGATVGITAASTSAQACYVVYKPATATGTPLVVTKPNITVHADGC